MTDMQNNTIEPKGFVRQGSSLQAAIFMFGGILLIAIPLYAMMLGKSVQKPSTLSVVPQVQKTQSETQPTQMPTPIPTIVPLAIVHKQDIDTALKLIDGTNTTSVEQQLNQINTSANSISQ